MMAVASDPLRAVAIALTPPVKVETLLSTVLTFVALPLLVPEFLLIATPHLAERFLSTKQEAWGMGFHYSLFLTLLAALASVYGGARASEPLKNLWHRLAGTRPASATVGAFLGIMCIVSTFLLDGWGAGSPAEFACVTKPYFSRHVDVNRRALAMIPAGASVAAQDHFVPHLATREKVWLLAEATKAQYVVASPDEGTWPYSEQAVIAVLRNLLVSGYVPIFSEGMTLVLQRNAVDEVHLSTEISERLL